MMIGVINMNKVKDWINRLKKGHMLSVIGVFLIIIVILGVLLYQKQVQAPSRPCACRNDSVSASVGMAGMAP